MIKKMIVGAAALATIVACSASAKTDDSIKDTAIFKVDKQKNEIVSLASNVKDYLKLKFVSVTTDQPIYWPNEDVFLKVLMPAEGVQKLSISLQKKDATPIQINNLSLNEGGILVHKILSGKNKKLEAGEYRIDVMTEDKKLQSYTTFSVVQGALGAMSFGYDFDEITDPAKLDKSKGAWFLGNAGGIGSRWGNGLNVKNEVRFFNKPYTGNVTIKSRCFLSGCNGVEAGPEIKKQMKEGKLEAVLDISSHSGPFEIEVITDKGSIRNLFARSGHVERQSIPITSNMSNAFNATLAPYENTIPVYGRDIYIEKGKEQKDDAIEFVSPIADDKNKVELKVKKDISNAKIFVLSYMKSDDVQVKEIPISGKLEKGKSIDIDCSAPYNFITVGGFIDKDFYEGWGLAFTPSSIDVDMKAADNTKPLTGFDVDIKTLDKITKKGIPMYGILEVFDNRVPSKSEKEPLASSLGDSIRDFSNYLVSWRDWTGVVSEEKELDGAANRHAVSVDTKVKAAPMINFKTSGKMRIQGESISPNANKEDVEITEAIREEELKVVYCGIVKTDANGIAKVNVKAPPQTGRCKVRFVAIDKFDYAEKIQDIDIKKNTFAEINLQPLIMPGAKVVARLHVENIDKNNIKVKITGEGLELEYLLKPGSYDMEFPVRGEHYGPLNIQVSNSSGKVVDKRKLEIKNISSIPVTYSDVIISDGKTITVDKGKRIAIYANPAQLLNGIIMNINTTMYSWFGHSEALSASAAVRGILLRAIDDKIINDEGLRDTLKSEMVKVVKDLNEKFYNKSSGLFMPYPGLPENDLWSIWAAKNLSIMVNALDTSKTLKTEFEVTINTAKGMINTVNQAMQKKNISVEENGLYDLARGQDLIPVEINGKVVYTAITDDAVVNWYINKMMPILDITKPEASPFDKGGLRSINSRFIKAYDTYRFLRAFERTGSTYYLLLNAKALFIKGDKNFYPLFNQIAKGLILTQEPGMIQGPALLGGVYSSPQTVVKFLDLLITMAKDNKIKNQANIEIDNNKMTVGPEPGIIEPANKAVKINSPQYTTVRIDTPKTINVYEYLSQTPFFKTNIHKKSLKVGDETTLTIRLDNDKDPSEYYAVIAVPSVLSIRQTEDLLSDYKGQILYGQYAGGGQKIQFITVPFRGSRDMVLNLEASQKGESDGYVLVRHISNPDIIATGKIEEVKVK